MYTEVREVYTGGYLTDVEDHKWGYICVAMDVKGVEPLYVLVDCVDRGVLILGLGLE